MLRIKNYVTNESKKRGVEVTHFMHIKVKLINSKIMVKIHWS